MTLSIFAGVLGFNFAVVLFLLKPKSSDNARKERFQLFVFRPGQELPQAEGIGAHRQAGLAEAITSGIEQVRLGRYLQRLLLHAGSTASAGSVVLISTLLSVGAGILAHVLSGALPVDMIAALAGMTLRVAQLRIKKSRRLKKFNGTLPDAIELMARALRAGHAMGSAIEIVGQQSVEPVASEFETVFRQQQLGIPFRDALIELAGRVPSKDLHFLITAILVQKETGGDLTEILDRTTHVIRERVRIEGEIRTYTAQGRLTGYILSAMPVIMLALINIVSPGYSHILFYDPLGQKLLYGGAALIILGGAIIRKIVAIKV